MYPPACQKIALCAQGNSKVFKIQVMKTIIVYFFGVIFPFNKHEKNVHCMSFHLKFYAYLYIYLKAFAVDGKILIG